MLSISTNTSPKASQVHMLSFLSPKTTTNTQSPRGDDTKRDLGVLFPFRFPSHRVNPEALSPKKSKILTKSVFVEAAIVQFKNKMFTFSNIDKKDLLNHDPIDEDTKIQMLEENALRQNQMILSLKDFLPLKVDPNEMTYAQRKMQTVLRENVIQLAERILGLYNVSCIYTTFPRIDSVLKLDTMNDRDALGHCFKAIIPEIVKFPYSFLKKIGFLSITFTNSILIFKSQDQNSINKKIYRGIFPISKLTTNKDRVSHLYKVIFYLIKVFFPNIDKEWIRMVPTEVEELYIGIYTNAKPRLYFQEQVEAFEEFMTNPLAYTYSGDRKKEAIGLRFKEILESIDPIGINDDWWKEMPTYVQRAEEMAARESQLKNFDTDATTERKKRRNATKKLEKRTTTGIINK